MATTNYKELRNAIGAWCSVTTGRVLRISGSGEIAQPRVPYAAVWLNQDAFSGYPRSQISEDGLTFTVTRTAQFRVQIDVYGGDDADKSAMQDGSLLMNSLYNPRLFETSTGANKNLWEICGLLSIEPMNDLSALETGIIKQRAQVVFNIMAEMSDNFASDYYDTVEADVRRKEPDIDVTTILVDPNAPPLEC